MRADLASSWDDLASSNAEYDRDQSQLARQSSGRDDAEIERLTGELHDLRARQEEIIARIKRESPRSAAVETDQVGAAAAGQSQVPPVDLADYAAISHAELATILVPQYMQEVPELDGWESPY